MSHSSLRQYRALKVRLLQEGRLTCCSLHEQNIFETSQNPESTLWIADGIAKGRGVDIEVGRGKEIEGTLGCASSHTRGAALCKYDPMYFCVQQGQARLKSAHGEARKSSI